MRLKDRKALVALVLVLINGFRISAQDTIPNTTIAVQDSVTAKADNETYGLNYKKLVVPAVFVAYGVASLKIDKLKQLDRSTRHEIWEHQPDHIRLDNYTQYVPAAIVYGLNAAGLKSKHNFKDRTIIYATSQLISGAFVIPLKHIVQQERPDGSNKYSFPSGHTATAFSSAHFMFREYKDTHFWLSLSGYSFAVFTGIYRTLNDKHWVSDVVAGAGFGILSTELAYWTYPKINALLSNKKKTGTTMIMPFYQHKGIGLSCVKNF